MHSNVKKVDLFIIVNIITIITIVTVITMSIITHKGTYVKLTDLNTSKDRFKLKFQNRDVKILYNYFNDFWEELCIDTWFNKIDKLNGKYDTTTITFTDDTKLMIKLTEVLKVVKELIDESELYIPTNNNNSMLGKQNKPKFTVCKQNNNGRLTNKHIFLGSKSKNYENTELKTLEELKNLYFDRITSVRMFIKPKLFVRKSYVVKINGINRSDVVISFNPFYTEYKYTKSGFKSPLNEGDQLKETELVNDVVDLSYNITV